MIVEIADKFDPQSSCVLVRVTSIAFVFISETCRNEQQEMISYRSLRVLNLVKQAPGLKTIVTFSLQVAEFGSFLQSGGTATN